MAMARGDHQQAAGVIVCNKHPNHRQQPGVCSCCLRESLSKLSPLPNSSTSMLFSSSNSSRHYNFYYSDHDHDHDDDPSSGSVSPPITTRRLRSSRHFRLASDVFGSIKNSMIMTGGGLKKSRSMASAAVRIHGTEHLQRRRSGRSGKKNGGLWSKLLRSTVKRTDNNKVIVH